MLGLLKVGTFRRTSKYLLARKVGSISQASQYGSTGSENLCSSAYRFFSRHLLGIRCSSNAPSQLGKVSCTTIPAALVIARQSQSRFSSHFLTRKWEASNASWEAGKRSGYSSYRSYATGSGNLMARSAQVAWKRLLLTSSSKDQVMNRIAQATILGMSRSYVIVPGLLIIMYGNQLASADAGQGADILQPQNKLYLHAQESHLIAISLVLFTFECIMMFLRAVFLAILFTPSIAMAPFADSFGPEFRKLWLRTVHQTLEKAGPAFIKWGQWAATRPDLFPRDLCTELSKLHFKAPQHSFAYTEKAIKRAFGRGISEIFDNFEEEPVASGSIAQVHRATLRAGISSPKPTLVAVKVRHPGVGESIKRDFDIINVIAKGSKFIPALNWLRLDESVHQFSTFMMSQVDLAREAAHLSRFIYNFRRWKNVSFPKPVYPLVHPAVLVETFEHGESLSYYVDRLEGHNRTKHALAHIGTHALLKMLLVDNFVHADMHPGNILVRAAQSEPPRRRIFKTKPHVVFLDVGMTAELSNNDRLNLLEFFKAVARRDGTTAAQCTLKMSKKQNCPTPNAFIQEVKESFDFWGTSEGDSVHPADCMHQLLEQVRRYKVNVDGNVCTVMVTVLVLEGWQRKLDPAYDVMHTLQSLLLKAGWAESLSFTIDGLMAP